MIRVRTLIGSAALAGLLAAPTQATPIVGQTLLASGGDVIVTFVSNDAGFTSELFLDGPAGDGFGTIFDNWTTNVGTSFNLGSFDAGTELIFRLSVKSTGDAFYTGDGFRNGDGIAHAIVDTRPDALLVGFEDAFGGGDFDFDDLVFSFTNVSGSASSDPWGAGGTGGTGSGSPETPAGSGGNVVVADEPATLTLLGSGLVALVLLMKRQAIRR
jgi:hypothetical protein